ncbi:MAG: hypothetical protein FWH40_08530 [Coriobacteriia bacterium]|nr:hypothetical protein [Coriobacteriia bacterium]
MRKRLMPVVSGILLVVLVSACLAACSSKGDPVDYAGKYVMTKAIDNGILLEGEAFELNYPADENYIEIIDSINIVFVIDSKRIETTYTREGDILHVDDPAGIVDLLFEDGDIVYSEDSGAYKLFFTKIP